MKKRFSMIDLFAGAGGLSLGFERTEKYETKLAVELNYHANLTYLANRNKVVVDRDIRSINFNEVRNLYGEIDVVIGGPPCQGFSNANRQRNDLISGNNNLVKQFIRAIEELQPKAFVMENVKTIASKSHKFFCSSRDGDELEQLEIETCPEEISIGEITRLSQELAEFFERTTDFRMYPVRSDISSLLNSMYRVRNSEGKLEFYLKKNEGKFRRMLSEWQQLRAAYWSREYLDIWDEFKSELTHCIEGGVSTQNLTKCLVPIVQIERVLSKMAEVSEHGIDFKVQCQNNEVLVNVETYGVYEYVLKKLESLGYSIKSGVLRATDFGVPQQRERCFIIGINENSVPGVEASLPKAILSEGQYFTIRHAIEDLEKYSPSFDVESNGIDRKTFISTNPLQEYLFAGATEIHNHVITETRSTALQRFKLLKQGQSFQDLDKDSITNYSDPKRTQKTVYLRQEYDRPSHTVVNVRKSMWIHPIQDRAISIREAARLQSFPDSYEFKGSKDAQYQQIGNAVPPLLGQAVAEHLLKLLGNPVDEEKSLSHLFKRVQLSC